MEKDLAPTPSLDPSIAAFDELVERYIGRLLSAAEKIEGKVWEATIILKEAFLVQRELLIKAKQCQIRWSIPADPTVDMLGLLAEFLDALSEFIGKPDLAGLAEFLEPLNKVILKADALAQGRWSNVFNHLQTVADSLIVLGWIGYSGKDCGITLPIAHVEESWRRAEIHNNKILVEHRNTDRNHVEWAKALKELYLPVLRDYVKVFYPLGPVWGPFEGLTVYASASTSSTSKAPPARAPAPPSPPPPFPYSILSPKLELQMGREWVVGNQIGKKNLVIDDCDSKHSVHVYRCGDSVLQVKGKVNNITIYECTKVGIVFVDVVAACKIVNCNGVDVHCQGVVAACEIVNCKGVEVHCRDVVAACKIVNCKGVEVHCQGSAPKISIDNTRGCQLYLSKDPLQVSMTTSKSCEINVLTPSAGPDSDWNFV